MYVTNEFAFIEMPKTGSTYIDQVMMDMLDGEKVGKHNYPSEDIFNSGRSFVGSIRNPFDWYVSLWAYGCKVKERSGPYRKTMSYRPFAFNGYAFDKNILFGTKAYSNYIVRAPFVQRDRWKSAYASAEPHNFRAWIDLMFRSDEVFLYNAILAQTPLKNFIGLYTFRYLWLCCRNREELLTSKCPKNLEELRSWEKENCYVDRFIKMESMSDGLLSLFADFGYALTNEQQNRLEDNKRHNASKRGRNLSDYYEIEQRDLVVARDKIIFDRFSYEY